MKLLPFTVEYRIPIINSVFIFDNVYDIRLAQLSRIFRALQTSPRVSYLDERTADVRTNCSITFSTRRLKCCKRVNIPSATLQRVDNFVSGKHFATM